MSPNNFIKWKILFQKSQMFTFHSAFDLYLDLYLDFTGRTYDYFIVSDQIKMIISNLCSSQMVLQFFYKLFFRKLYLNTLRHHLPVACNGKGWILKGWAEWKMSPPVQLHSSCWAPELTSPHLQINVRWLCSLQLHLAFDRNSEICTHLENSWKRKYSEYKPLGLVCGSIICALAAFDWQCFMDCVKGVSVYFMRLWLWHVNQNLKLKNSTNTIINFLQWAYPSIIIQELLVPQRLYNSD